MCGIIGGFDIPQIEKGLHAISHRGPDNQQVIQMDNVYFGHVRLSIIDIKTSALISGPIKKLIKPGCATSVFLSQVGFFIDLEIDVAS